MHVPISPRAVLRRVAALRRAYAALDDEGLLQRYRALRGQTGPAARDAAFALACEAFRRRLGLEPYDEQLLGALWMAEGRVAQLQTGEGKTVSAVLTACVWALDGKGVHVATANAYLARRDAEWMGPVYAALGIGVGIAEAGMPFEERKAAYGRDVVYGAYSEFGFDYLRDRLAPSASRQVQPPPAYMLVDEADSILLDEAVTPLILSGQGDGADEAAIRVADRFAGWLKPVSVTELDDESEYYRLNEQYDYVVEERKRAAFLTERGQRRAEQYFRLKSLDDDLILSHRIFQAIQARGVFRRDVDYLVRDGRLVIVDAHTGRPMEGRRYCDGLWQALEAKEGLEILNESFTLASISVQQLMRRYPVMSGMTGTASEGRDELRRVYGLPVTAVRPHRPCIRRELPDAVYPTAQEKLRAVCAEASAAVKRRQPCLVVTRTVEENERLSEAFATMGLEHHVLSAKHHAEEAAVIARAGEAGALTVATAMAGRGTDIRLSEESKALGGLYVIGFGRQNTRRGDRQLAGRCARQGEPGQSRFFVAEDDELLSRFGQGKLPSDERARRRAIRRAQKTCESLAAGERVATMELDGAVGVYRERVYRFRDGVLRGQTPEGLWAGVPAPVLRRVALPLVDQAWAGFLREAEEAKQRCGAVSLTGRDYRSEYLRELQELYEAMKEWLTKQMEPHLGGEGEHDESMGAL